MDKAVLLADPKSKAWDFAQKMQEYISQEKRIKIPLDEARIKFFDNGEVDMYVPKNIREKEVYFVHDSTLNPQEWWVKLLLMSNLLHLASAGNINYVLPDMKYSRQDRKPRSRVPISANALSFSLIPYQRIKKIFTMDLHAQQITGFYSPNIILENLSSTPSLVKFIREKSGIDLENLVIVAADKGDVDRAEELSNRLHLKFPPANVYKEKHPETRKIIKMDLIGNVEGKDVLTPDDIIGSGMTLLKGRELLLQKGALKTYCSGTHGWFTGGIEIIADAFDIAMISNTNNKDYGDKIKVIDVSPIFAEAIYRAHRGESVSQLFE